MRRAIAIWLTSALAALAAVSASDGAGLPPSCKGGDLGGSFTVVRGSAGAGSISYLLRLTNRSQQTCIVTGLPIVGLLDANGRRLPTHERPITPGIGTAILVRLAPGQSTTATARFSPDVPGVGEPVAGRRCEHTAYKLRVGARGGGSTIVAIRPATPVCEHGSMAWSLYSRL
jgi:hypothetical protein